MAPRILVVLTNVGKIESAGDKPTGWYLPELAHPYDILSPKAEIVVASPKGGLAPLDPASVELFKDESSVNFLNTHKALWENTEELGKFSGKASEFDAIFYPGGHGPMFDLVSDPTSQALIADFYTQGKLVAAVCHGSAALVNAKLPSGESILAGKEVTGFSNAEEDQAGHTPNMPFALETSLNEKSGGKYVKAADTWAPKVVVVGNLITGQNPASAKPLGEALVKALGL